MNCVVFSRRRYMYLYMYALYDHYSVIAAMQLLDLNYTQKFKNFLLIYNIIGHIN